MDLNQEPIQDLPRYGDPIPLVRIRFVYGQKLTARDAIVRRYGESGYERVIQDQTPFLMVGVVRTSIIIFVLS
jgi:hypothetical protein